MSNPAKVVLGRVLIIRLNVRFAPKAYRCSLGVNGSTP